jgi:hypothetical protein
VRLGPFNPFDVDALTVLLESNKIKFEIFFDKDKEKKILEKSNRRLPQGANLDLAIVYFDIADEDFEGIKDALEKYGIVAPSDGSYELGEE